MERVARLPARERSELFSESAAQKGTHLPFWKMIFG
jgi:hypothetical protein